MYDGSTEIATDLPRRSGHGSRMGVGAWPQAQRVAQPLRHTGAPRPSSLSACAASCAV